MLLLFAHQGDTGHLEALLQFRTIVHVVKDVSALRGLLWESHHGNDAEHAGREGSHLHNKSVEAV